MANNIPGASVQAGAENSSDGTSGDAPSHGSATSPTTSTGAPGTAVKLTPAGRPLLHFSNYTGEVQSAPTVLSDAINKLNVGTLSIGDPPQLEKAMAGLRSAQSQANTHLLNGAVPHERELSLALSAMTGGKLVGPLDVIGFERYDSLDLGWVKSFLNYLGSTRVPFPTHLQLPPATRTTSWMPEQVTLAIAGDWGTGTEPALSIGKSIAGRNPDYTIHLGDVYYSGLPEEESAKLVEVWPEGSRGSFTMNSNHEMYAGGNGYFGVAMTNPKFALQSGLSYFALQNRNWIVLGLDSAYFAVDSLLYQDGYLSTPGATNGTVQLDWFRGMIEYAAHDNKNVIILTHHDGFDVDPYANTATFKKLYQVMADEMKSIKRWWWYWAHVHAGIAYRKIVNGGSTLYPRCIGHGGIPWEPFPALSSIHLNDSRVGVEWGETRTVTDSQGNERALNGYLTVTLAGDKIIETLYDERNNAINWTAHY